jgi:hypothetical protein
VQGPEELPGKKSRACCLLDCHGAPYIRESRILLVNIRSIQDRFRYGFSGAR